MKVLYHANCTDGSGAALAAWMKLGDELDTGEEVEYIPVQYGSPPPVFSMETIYILDFSYPRDVLLEMGRTAERIVVIDHHRTAEADLREEFPREHNGMPVCRIERVFDMEKSGAVLAWEYFHPNDPVPYLLKLIQDRDLWRWEFADTKYTLKGLQIYPDWREWDKWTGEQVFLNSLYQGGQSINRFLEIETKKIIKIEPIEWRITGDTIPIYNLPGFMISDTLHMALEKYPDAPYAVAYFDLPDKRVYSLRSRQSSDIDVSAIAKEHGGGGHKHAAGFTVPMRAA